MNIVTLTLNPAFDVHYFVENFAPFHENLGKITDREASGKGVNISRALCANNVDNLAFLVLGKENAEDFKQGVNGDGISYREITVDGRIRENITIHTNNSPETRISFSGFNAQDGLLDDVEKALSDIVGEGTLVTFTGRVTSGMPMSAVKAFVARLREKGARVVVDSKSFSLDDIIEVKPWLIKPNEEEIGEYLGRDIKDFDEVVSAAQELYGEGIENVMISLGEKGALLVCEEGVFVAEPPHIDALSTIGAGDSTIGGFLAGAVLGQTKEEMLRTAVAYGTAACLTSGTKPPRKEDVDVIVKQVKILKKN